MQPDGNFEDYLLEGSVLKIGKQIMDIDELQKEEQVIIDIIEDGRFVANIIIPPAVYEEIQEPTVEGEPSIPPVKVLIDMDAVKLILWDKPILTVEGE
ncbi:MAG: hypothetical protein V2A75_07980 [Pseudomonadota bacterium]